MFHVYIMVVIHIYIYIASIIFVRPLLWLGFGLTGCLFARCWKMMGRWGCALKPWLCSNLYSYLENYRVVYMVYGIWYMV